MMQKDELESLLWRYQNDLCTEDERRQVDEWYQSLQPGDQHRFDIKELGGIRQSIRNKITGVPAPSKVKKKRSGLYLIGSSITVMVILLWYTLSLPSVIKSTSGEVQFANTFGHNTSLQLPDGSQVTLFPGASVKYPAAFSASRREVFLQGVGFFSVVKDSSRPFYVRSEQLTVKVLGTSFYVRSGPSQASVEVQSGRVEVFKTSDEKHMGSKQPASSVILTPNQQTTYTQGTDSFKTALIDSPQQLRNGERTGYNKLVFENAAVEKVFNDLGETYGIAITTQHNALRDCRFTGDISDPALSLYEKLQMVCQVVDASYVKQGVEILIQGKGCQ